MLSACDSQTAHDPNLADTPALQQCLLKRGYRQQSQRLVADEPAPPLPPRCSIGVYTYDHTRGRTGAAGGEAAEQAATRACDRGVSDRIGAPAFDSCMAAHGWRFAGFTPAQDDNDSTPTEDAAASSAPDLPTSARWSATSNSATTPPPPPSRPNPSPPISRRRRSHKHASALMLGRCHAQMRGRRGQR